VVDFSTEIAGPYCTKLFADAGADVVKVETPDGDPLRRWSATDAPLGDEDGALFRYLHHSKRAIVGAPDDRHVTTLVAAGRAAVPASVPPRAGRRAPPPR